jgi:gluconate 5-dehydrogenase
MIIDTNLRGPFFVAQAVAKTMIPRSYGRIINIGSVTCVFGYGGLAPYCASRGGIKQLTMSLADDWGPAGHARADGGVSSAVPSAVRLPGRGRVLVV